MIHLRILEIYAVRNWFYTQNIPVGYFAYTHAYIRAYTRNIRKIYNSVYPIFCTVVGAFDSTCNLWYEATVCVMLWSLLVSIIDEHRWFFDAFNGMHPEVTPVEGVDVDI